MTRPHGITGSLTPTFVPALAVAVAVRRPSAFALIVRLPTALRAPLRASVTISEATAPVKLPASHGPRRCERPREIVNKTRVVFHCWLPQGQNPGIVASHLCYASHADDQWQAIRSEEHTSELQSHSDLVCRLLLEKKKKKYTIHK